MAVAQRDPFETLDQSLAAAVANVAPSVLHLARPNGGGSALVWREDLAVTSSFHCPDEPSVLVSDAGGELASRKAEVVGRDPGLDLALLRFEGGGLVVPARREAATVAVGNLALAIGRPGRSPRASLRMISVRGAGVRTPTGGVLEHYLDTDRQIPRGFAGGPLVDVQGAVIGMSTRTLLRGHDLAISVADVERSVALLLAHGAVPRGFLGVGVAPVVLARALRQAHGRERAVLVSALDEGGPAELAGVVQGDVLLALDGHPIEGPLELRERVAERPGAEVELLLARGGAPLTVRATLGIRR